jgi:hypothetical protein
MRFGENHITLEETITLALDASDEDIQQAVELGWRIYRMQHESLTEQVAGLSENWGTPTPAARTIRDPDAPASERQRGYISNLQHNLSWDNEQLTSYASEQGLDLVHITKGQASNFIEDLKKLAEERGATYQATSAMSTEPGTLNTNQREVLTRLAQKRGIDLDAEIQQRFGLAVDDMSNQQAGELITEWQRR